MCSFMNATTRVSMRVCSGLMSKSILSPFQIHSNVCLNPIYALATRRQVVSSRTPRRLGSAGDADRKGLVALHEIGAQARRLRHDLDQGEALQHLLPDNAELHLGQPLAEAAVDAEAEGDVLAR